ncbi:MAG TPA: Gfo/Idh/MocA family oxidoreductase [Candidatus Saccharimonadales bacterium]|nr:Gfo/Idh/MocA family oxidoreductase [Candidatus Saccharimonadales bacterium]
MNDQKPNQTPFTRRTFLQSASKGLAGATLLSALPVERFALGASPGDTIKIALIGCGGRGSGAADQALVAGGEGVKIVAMADAFKDRLDGAHRELSRKHRDRVDVKDDNKFVGLNAYKEAIAQADMVILATPPGFRPIHFEEAVRQGKNVFMEKPVAVDGPGVRRVLAAAAEAKKKNLKVGVGLQRHHQPNYIKTIQRLHDGAIGDIVAMRVYWDGGPVGPKKKRSVLAKELGRTPTEMEYQIANWYMFTWLCGDHIVEQHIHNIDVANWVLKGYPTKASGVGGRAYQKGPDSGEIYDHFNVEYEYEGGVRVFSQCRQIPGFAWNPVSEHAIGTKGTCDVSSFIIRGANPWRYKPAENEKSNDGWQLEHYPLQDAIRGDKDYNEAERGAFSSLAAIMGRMSAYSGKEVTWEQALNSKLVLAPDQFTWDAMPKVVPGPDGNYPVATPGPQTVAF